MPAYRYFLDIPLVLNENISLSGAEAHHLLHVMRTHIGEQVEIVNGCNQLAIGQLISNDKKVATLLLIEIRESPPPKHPIIICQAIPRFNRLETILEKGTELGMTSIWLFPGVHSEKKEISSQQHERMKAIMISAMKQCGRLDLPTIEIKPPLTKWSKKEIIYPAYFGDVNPQAPKFLDLWIEKNGILFFVGPEAGFSEKEEKHLIELGVQGVKLHPNILRTETASLVVLSQIFSQI